ncbi:hypothetical protein ACWGQ5_56575 [Streptomyces sp. NPDC055722]
MPEGRFGAAGAALDGRRYAVGGCTNTDCSNTVYVFDPRSGAWSRPRTTFQTISWASCGAINGKLVLRGRQPRLRRDRRRIRLRPDVQQLAVLPEAPCMRCPKTPSPAETLRSGSSCLCRRMRPRAAP